VLVRRLRHALSRQALGVHFASVLFMGPLAALTIEALREVHLVAATPVWLIPAILVGGQSLTIACGFWWDANPTSAMRLQARIGSQAVVVAATIYATGWGPALAIGLVLVGQEALTIVGWSARFSVIAWSLGCLAVGEVLIALHWVPSLIPAPEVHGLALLAAIGIAFSYRSLRSSLIEKENTAAHFRAVVENAAEAIYTIGLDGMILTFNPAAEAMFGWNAGDVIGLNVKRLTTDDRAEAVERFLAAYAVPSSSPVENRDVEMIGRRHDDSTFPVLVSTSAIRIDASPPVLACIARDMSEQKRFEAQLAHYALHDALTGLPNRMKFSDHLDHVCRRAGHDEHELAVLFVDLDGFKRVNDSLGHAAGDRLLDQAAVRLRAAVRGTDIVARLGGDEFVVLCEPLDSVYKAEALARRILTAMQVPFHLGGDDVATISASIGLTVGCHADDTPESIIARADRAMYRAKASGRNRYHFYESTDIEADRRGLAGPRLSS
jgi:diguanylate cyclase (GGDEF)-like protein/PAS domain S-box-containing protein